MTRPIDRRPAPRRRRSTRPAAPAAAADAALAATAGADQADAPDAAPPGPGERLDVEHGAAAPPLSIEALPADVPEAGLGAFGGRDGTG